MRWTICCTASIVFLCNAAFAQDYNWIFQHNGNLHEGEHYNIVQDPGDVTIRLGVEGQVFQFEARIGHWEGETWIDANQLGDINLIQADENAGEVAIRVMPHFGEEYGARDIREIRLGADDVNSAIYKLLISGNLGDPEKDPIVADVIAGTFRVQGDIVHDIAIEWLTGDICCASLENLWVITPTIPIAGDFSGSLEIDGYLAGALVIAGDVLDSGDNHIRIEWMGGRFQCQRMELSQGRDNWLTFGEASPGYPHWGEIDIDTLAGVMEFLAPSECQITVGEVDAGPEPDPEMSFGGIRLANGCTDNSRIYVGALRQGWIATSAYAGGLLYVLTDIGQESPARVARIVSSYERQPVGSDDASHKPARGGRTVSGLSDDAARHPLTRRFVRATCLL